MLRDARSRWGRRDPGPEKPAALMIPLRAGQPGGSEQHPFRVPAGDSRPPRHPGPTWTPQDMTQLVEPDPEERT